MCRFEYNLVCISLKIFKLSNNRPLYNGLMIDSSNSLLTPLASKYDFNSVNVSIHFIILLLSIINETISADTDNTKAIAPRNADTISDGG